MQYWAVIRSACETHGAEGYPTYGVQVTLSDGRVWCWADVDVDEAAVTRLARRLQCLQPSECHFRDMVLDFIQEQAQKV